MPFLGKRCPRGGLIPCDPGTDLPKRQCKQPSRSEVAINSFHYAAIFSNRALSVWRKAA
jgi:hypothetical protein